MTRQAPMNHRQRRKARDLIDRKRAAPNSFRAGTVPPLGHVFDDGEVFEGIPGGKMEPRSIGSDPMDDGFLLKRHFGGADNPDLTTGVMVPVDRLRGAGQKISGDLIPDNFIRGSYNGKPGILAYSDLGGKPDLSRFLTSKDIENKASHAWVQNYLKKHLKKSAFKAGG